MPTTKVDRDNAVPTQPRDVHDGIGRTQNIHHIELKSNDLTLDQSLERHALEST